MVSQEILNEMQKLREQGLTYKEIGERLGLNPNTVNYHLNPEYKKRVIERVRKRYHEILKKNPEYVQKRRERIKQYIKKRLETDENFRERYREILRKSAKRRVEKIKMLRKEYPEYDEAIRQYYKDIYNYGVKIAYQNHRENVLKLREKYGIFFPML